MNEPVFSFAFAVEIAPVLLQAAAITLAATIASFAVAASLGLLLALIRRLPGLNATADAIRSTPLLVQLYAAYYLLPEVGISLDPLPTGILVMGVHFACYMAEVYRAGIESVPAGQRQAAAALGLRWWPTMRRIILPQAIPPIIPPLGNYLIAMFKETPLLSTITVTELLMRAKLIGAETFRYFEAMTLVGLIFLILSLTAARGIAALSARATADTRQEPPFGAQTARPVGMRRWR